MLRFQLRRVRFTALRLAKRGGRSEIGFSLRSSGLRPNLRLPFSARASLRRSRVKREA